MHAYMMLEEVLGDLESEGTRKLEGALFTLDIPLIFIYLTESPAHLHYIFLL
jgi:hypothetical protein